MILKSAIKAHLEKKAIIEKWLNNLPTSPTNTDIWIFCDAKKLREKYVRKVVNDYYAREVFSRHVFEREEGAKFEKETEGFIYDIEADIKDINVDLIYKDYEESQNMVKG